MGLPGNQACCRTRFAAVIEPGIALGAVAVELFFPLHHIPVAAVSLNQFRDATAALARTLRALDAEHIELPLDVAEDEEGPGYAL